MEVLIVLAIVGMVVGVTLFGFGAIASSRLRQATTQVAGAIRIANTHATSTSKVVRLDFDFEERKIYLQESEGRHLLSKDSSGGAEAANEIEAQANEAAGASTLRAPKASFSNAAAMYFPEQGVDLPSGIQFWLLDTTHQEQPIREGHAYLYFFPGGQTEAAVVQLRISNADDGEKYGFMSVHVSPLTGKTKIHKGRVDLLKPRDDTEASELEDPGT